MLNSVASLDERFRDRYLVAASVGHIHVQASCVLLPHEELAVVQRDRQDLLVRVAVTVAAALL
jgi:hypothetical protein